MPSIVPSAALLRDRYALVSHLRAQGFAIGTGGGRPQAGEYYLIADGETPPA
ncbi:MAG: sigma-54-dependent Fis family transcriptional regulator, partial [Sphingomonas bacterium]|nr:sigma-54-dependent Fis family transcriptional regulator [Sphingomonas bacterium]